MLRKKLSWLLGPVSSFKVGDTVQLRKGGDLMVVIEVIKKRGMNRPLLHCEWYELNTKQTRRNLFPEEDIELFDWYKANKSS